MPSNDQPGRWRGWWEGVVDLMPEKGGGKRDFSLDRLFSKGIPRIFPEADESVLRLIMPDEDGLRMDRQPGYTDTRWIDGKRRQVVEWDLLDKSSVGKDIRFWWDGEDKFQYRKQNQPLRLQAKSQRGISANLRLAYSGQSPRLMLAMVHSRYVSRTGTMRLDPRCIARFGRGGSKVGFTRCLSLKRAPGLGVRVSPMLRAQC